MTLLDCLPRAVGIATACALLLAGSACQNPPKTSETAPVAPVVPPPVLSDTHEAELRAILDMARAGDWEDAASQAGLLYAMNPDNRTVERVYRWTIAEGQRRREKALETELRGIESQDSRFNPNVRSVLLEQRSRGLDLPNELRQALDDVQQVSVIPDTYGRVIEKQGPMFEVNGRRTAMDDVLDQPITVQLDDVSLESIIFTIGRNAGVNFVADRSLPQFQRKLSVNMKDVRLAEFLDYISRNMELHFEAGENLIWIVDAKEKKNLFEETRFFRLRRGFIMPAQFGAHEITQVTVQDKDKRTTTETQKVEQFVRDGAPPTPSIETAIAQFFTGSKFMIDYERNIIVASGTRDQLRVLEEIIREFDRPVQQVLIEARFITVTEAAFLQLGVNWETGRDPLSSNRGAVDFTGFGTNVGLGLEHTFRNVFSRQNLSATLTALEQSGESQTLSSPRLTVVNNRPATIRDGKTQYYYEEYQVQQTILERRSSSTLAPKGKPTKLTSGVSLDVLASIGGDGKSIMLALKPSVSQDVRLVTFATVSDRDDQGRLVSTFDIRLPESRDQELSTRVVVRSGETIAMGGVIERTQSTFTEAVPILGSIPVIGAAFRKKTEFDQPRYLLIFVTATLLSERGEFIVYNDEEF
jgi:type IV pilus assembly protein PilQ